MNGEVRVERQTPTSAERQATENEPSVERQLKGARAAITYDKPLTERPTVELTVI